MSILILSLVALSLAAVGYAAARARAAMLEEAPGTSAHSRPTHHGWYVALCAAVPALLFVAAWSFVAPGLSMRSVLASPEAAAQSAAPTQRQLVLGGLGARAASRTGDPRSRQLLPVYRAAQVRYGWIGLALASVLALAGGSLAYSRINPGFRARSRVERCAMAGLLVASLIAIFTTVGIVGSLLFESLRFFRTVSPIDFLFGTVWSPQTAIRADQVGSSGAFGAVPLFWGTIFIGAIIAMIVAVPLGLMSAIYLTQYATPATRRWMKPTLEILAGIPTVVYGYFAAISVAPALRDLARSIGISGASGESALAAGSVMGIMIIPFISSMADDSLAAVPQAMRDGSLAIGATTSETIRRVLLPAALPGVAGGVLLAVSRAIGETMIVVMAAGLAANMTANPFAPVTTVTTQIVQLLTGDQEFDSPKTLAAFALGLVLFLATLALNIVALRVVKRYREAYE